jgi:hypothetical protein
MKKYVKMCAVLFVLAIVAVVVTNVRGFRSETILKAKNDFVSESSGTSIGTPIVTTVVAPTTEPIVVEEKESACESEKVELENFAAPEFETTVIGGGIAGTTEPEYINGIVIEINDVGAVISVLDTNSFDLCIGDSVILENYPCVVGDMLNIDFPDGYMMYLSYPGIIPQESWETAVFN